MQLLAAPEQTMSSIAILLGVSRSTLYTHLPELERAVAVAQGALVVRAAALES